MATYSKKKQTRQNRHRGFSTQIPVLSEEEMYQLLAEHNCPFILALDQVQDPHNLGAIMRSADASGVDVVVAPKKGAPPITETVRHIACGGAEHVPYVQVSNLANALRKFRELEIRIVATSDHKGSISLFDCDFAGPVAVVMGAEAAGVRRLTAELSDDLVKIPMSGEVDCLNVSVATGVTLFAAVRQRHR